MSTTGQISKIKGSLIRQRAFFYTPEALYRIKIGPFLVEIYPGNTGPTILICNHFQTFHLCLFSVVGFDG